MPTITAITAEVQVRCNALTGASTASQVIDCMIAAKKVELAGGTLSRTILDTQIQRINDASNSGSAIEDLVALAAMQGVSSSIVDATPVGSFVQGLFSSSKYLPCAGGTYLKAAYPALDSTMLSTLAQQVYTTSSTAMSSTALSATMDTNKFQNAKLIDAGSGAAYLIGGASSWATQGSNPSYYRTLTNPGVLVYSPDGGTTLVDHSARLTSVADMICSGPTSANSLTDMRIDDLIIIGTTIILAGRGTYYTGASNYVLFYAVSRDSGVTYTGTVVSSGSSYQTTPTTNMARLAAIGNSVVLTYRQGPAMGSMQLLVSTDKFVNVQYVSTGAGYSATKTTVSLTQNGTRFNILFNDGTSAYTTAADPAAANWNAVAAMPSVTSLYDGGVVGTKFIAVGSNGYIATCVTPGTWVYQSTAATSMAGVVLASVAVLGTTIAVSPIAGSANGGVYYCTDTGALPAMTLAVADDNLTAPTKSTGVHVANSKFIVLMANSALLKSATLLATSWAVIQCIIPTTNSTIPQEYIPVVKFGCTFIQRGMNRYVSYDGLTFRPAVSQIAVGQGFIIDAGTRLLAMDDQQLLWQSTDGKTWDTTGITRPTVASTPQLGQAYYSVLDVCAGYIFLTVTRNNGSAYTYVTTNSAATWNATNGLNQSAMYQYSASQLDMGRRFWVYNSKIYALMYYYNGSTWATDLYTSVDSGVTFSWSANTTYDNSQSANSGFIEYNSMLYCTLGAGFAYQISPTGANRLAVTTLPAPLNTLLAAKSYADKSSATQRVYSTTTGYIVMYTGAGLTASSRYKPLAPSNMWWYSASQMNVVSNPSQFAASQLFVMPDTADSFTLPTLANTWLRAVA